MDSKWQKQCTTDTATDWHSEVLHFNSLGMKNRQLQDVWQRFCRKEVAVIDRSNLDRSSKAQHVRELQRRTLDRILARPHL